MKKAHLDIIKIIEYMEKQKLGTSAMAKLLGIDTACLSRLLHGKRGVGGNVWEALIGYFGKKIFDYIFFEDDLSNDKI